jgi:hypothetical protein
MYNASFFGSFHATRQRLAILYERRRAVLFVYVNAWRLQCAVKGITPVHQQREMTFLKGRIRMARVRKSRGMGSLAKCFRHL